MTAIQASKATVPSVALARNIGVMRWAAAGALVCGAALLGLAALFNFMPDPWYTHFGHNAPAARDFQRALFGTVLPRLGYRPFQLAFRALLALGWGGYALALAAGLRGGLLPARWVLAGSAIVAVASALLCPPSLSHDCYFYVGYARMALVYGLNPYAHTQNQLIARHEPFAPWLGPSGYGPLWTLLSMGLFTLSRGDAAWAQPALLKLLEAAALIAAALAGRAVARRYSPGREDLTLLAIALNPLFMIEGPGSGHNDLLMLALLLAGAAFCAHGRYAAGILVVGFSIGIKYITGACVPWLWLERARGRSAQQAALDGLVTIALALAPTALAFVPFWTGPSALVGVTHHAARGGATPGAAALYVQQQLAHLGVANPGAAQAMLALAAPLAVLYGGISLWIGLKGRSGQWMIGWVALMTCLIFTTEFYYPWYFIWPTMVCLTRWEPPQKQMSIVCLVMSAFLTLIYTRI